VCAADWSDTAVSWRYGTRFAEPYNPEHIKKHIFALTHASGYKYGSNFFNVDLLQSDKNDPASLTQSEGAQEAYIVYRHTLDIGALRGTEMRYGAVKGVGLTFGFDWNTKNDVGYNSRKRMLVAGPTLMWDVPGFLNTSILLLRESNAPSGAFPPISNVNGRYTYDTHAMLSATWALMYDVGYHFGQPKNRFRLGLEYQFWNNKFGNTRKTTGGQGQRASTPMVRAEYHF